VTLIDLGSYSDLPLSGSEPRVPARFLDRPRLYERLDEAADAPVAGIVAPAGWGKSLLAAGWSRARGTADRTLWLGATTPALRAAQIVRELAAPGRLERIVVDDLHLLGEEQSHALLRSLARPGIPILAVSRRPLARAVRTSLGVRLHELSADELGFSDDEIRALLELADREPSDEAVRRVRAGTHGWPAAVRGLAEERIGRAADIGRLRPSRSILAFVSAEILADLPDRLVDLALRAAVVDVPDPGQLAALLDEPATVDGLDELVDAGLMNDDGDRYAFVPGLATCLRELLRRQCPATHATLQTRAASWYAAHGDAARALEHAELSGDAALSTDLLRALWTSLALEAPERLRSLLLALPAEVRRDDRELRFALAVAWTSLDTEAARDLLRGARELPPPSTADPAEALRQDLLENLVSTLVAGRAGDSLARERAAAGALLDRIATRTTDPDSALADAITAFSLVHGTALMVFGQLERAAAVLRLGASQAAFAGRPDRAGVLLAHEAMCRLLDGDLEGAGTCLQRCEGAAGSRLAAASLALARGLVHLESGDAVRARKHLHEARKGHLDPVLRPLLLHAEGIADLLAGDFEVGLERLSSLMGPTPGAPHTTSYLAELLAGTRELLAARVAGHPGVGVTPVPSDATAWRRMAHTTALVLGGDSRAALTRARLEIETAPVDARRTRIDFLLLAATAALDVDDHVMALGCAERALSRAELTGSWRAVQQLPRAVLARLLAVVENRSASQTSRVLATSARQRLGLPDPGDGERAALTRRELLVLAQLGSGRPASVIAAELYVSPNTLKTQLRSIYRKLGVASRAEAVQVSRDLGIIG
jgi:LuxR family maltose regulon positive regulatory protein